MAYIYPNSMPTYNPYLTQVPIMNPVIPNYQPVQPPPTHMEIQRVNGREGANAFPMGPNSSVILADTVNPKIWIVTTDAAGYKMVTGMKISPDEEEPIKTEGTVEELPKEDPIKELTERIEKLEKEMKNYGQSNYRSAGQSKPNASNVRADVRTGSGGEQPDGRASANG